MLPFISAISFILFKILLFILLITSEISTSQAYQTLGGGESVYIILSHNYSPKEYHKNALKYP